MGATGRWTTGNLLIARQKTGKDAGTTLGDVRTTARSVGRPGASGDVARDVAPDAGQSRAERRIDHIWDGRSYCMATSHGTAPLTASLRKLPTAIRASSGSAATRAANSSARFSTRTSS